VGKGGIYDVEANHEESLRWSGMEFFLEETMRRMGFDNRWIKHIMTSISIVTYSVLINGQPCGQNLPL
jgi:hypothetical protein